MTFETQSESEAGSEKGSEMCDAYIPLGEAELDSSLQATLGFKEEMMPASPKNVFSQLALTREANSARVVFEDIFIKPGLNVRVKDAGYHAHVRVLADSIKANGFYAHEPIVVWPVQESKKIKLYVVDGHCRYDGLALALNEGADINDVPVLILDKSVSQEDLMVFMAMSITKKKLSPLEVSIVCKRLRGFGWTPNVIAERLCITVEYVHNLLTLASSPKSIRDMVACGEVAAALAVSMIRTHGSDTAEVLDEALLKARDSGKSKVTARFLPERARKKAFTKEAPKMFCVIERLAKHKLYKSLPTDMREMIDQIISGIPEEEINTEDTRQGALIL